MLPGGVWAPSLSGLSSHAGGSCTTYSLWNPWRSCPERCQKVWTRQGWGREEVERKFHGLAGTRGRGSSTVLGRTRGSGKIPEGLRRARGLKTPEVCRYMGFPLGTLGTPGKDMERGDVSSSTRQL